MDYDAILAQVHTMLQQEQRLAYRVLKRRLQLDDDVLALQEQTPANLRLAPTDVLSTRSSDEKRGR